MKPHLHRVCVLYFLVDIFAATMETNGIRKTDRINKMTKTAMKRSEIEIGDEYAHCSLIVYVILVSFWG